MFGRVNPRLVNVRDYGVVGDGVTDNFAAMQALLKDGAERHLFSGCAGSSHHAVDRKLAINDLVRIAARHEGR